MTLGLAQARNLRPSCFRINCRRRMNRLIQPMKRQAIPTPHSEVRLHLHVWIPMSKSAGGGADLVGLHGETFVG
jgi:hypothetical protein